MTVDWSPVAAWDYVEARRVVPLISDFVVEMLTMLMEYGMKPESVHLLGHSLGAHIVGIAGLRSPVLLPRITGQYAVSGKKKFRIDINNSQSKNY